MAKVIEQEIIETTKSTFESFIASVEKAREDLEDVVKKGYDILGIEYEQADDGTEDAGGEASGEEEVDIDTLDIDGLLEVAEQYDVEIPKKTMIRGEDAVRDFIKTQLGIEDVAPEEEEEPAPTKKVGKKKVEEEDDDDEVASKIRTKLKTQIAKKGVAGKLKR
jgi:hypothetical protein